MHAREQQGHERTRRLRRRAGPPLPMRPGSGAAFLDRRPPVRPVRAALRTLAVLLWTLLAGAIQAVLLLLPGRAKVEFARQYWATVCTLLGLRVRVVGELPPGARDGARPVVFVANHSSWLDIPVLGGQLRACFVSKEEVGRWPVISVVARLGRTVFVSRRAARTGQERDEMRRRLETGDSLILFPEGTSSDGTRVLPFRSSFFSVFETGRAGRGAAPLLVPVSLAYDRLCGLPTGRASRPVFAWYGGMDLAPHFWRLVQLRGLRATVLIHPAMDPADWPSRKALAQAAWAVVADGASTLRQNRPARPIAAPAPPRPSGASSAGQVPA